MAQLFKFGEDSYSIGTGRITVTVRILASFVTKQFGSFRSDFVQVIESGKIVANCREVVNGMKLSSPFIMVGPLTQISPSWLALRISPVSGLIT